MNIDKHLESVRDGVQHAAALADDRTRQVAEQLGTALEPTIRLTLVQALAEAATEISARTSPTTVALRLDGDQPVFDVTVPDVTSAADDGLGGTEDELDPDEAQLGLDSDDDATARVSLRIPQSLKDRVDQVAAAQGVSTNVWITQALTRVVIRQTWRGPGGRGRGFGPQADERDPGELPVPPFGPEGDLPPGWPFGPRGHRGPRGRGRGGRRGGPGDLGGAPGERPGPGAHRRGPAEEPGPSEG
ncbi:toxin-antitoxin system HicB family antitoxin [Auraticoccus monumenti]|uniref:HicB family protein n=1 Tax=Auraticoccus monumenti TaxID=675864 RepID=A0A1G6VR64_9ACTN|nr:toxin-antitoxin system HicB family antitoxin [Auraticoccus monumenti]SDD56024.1 HicB family protein [Auraticoccus monumenti]